MSPGVRTRVGHKHSSRFVRFCHFEVLVLVRAPALAILFTCSWGEAADRKSGQSETSGV